MENHTFESILDMGGGGFKEVTDLEVTRIFQNIADVNTSATAKRKITIIMEFKADDSRQNIGVSYTVKPCFAPTHPVTTVLYARDERNVVEMVPQIPGQLGVDGGEQEAPPMLRLINFN